MPGGLEAPTLRYLLQGVDFFIYAKIQRHLAETIIEYFESTRLTRADIDRTANLYVQSLRYS